MLYSSEMFCSQSLERSAQDNLFEINSVQVSNQEEAVSPVFETYWRFAAERQRVFFRRLLDEQPATSDPILSRFKFTNAYRASDRVSQFLIRNVIYSGEQTPTEVFFRTILFKIFNKIDTWELLREKFEEVSTRTFQVDAYSAILSSALGAGKRIYSAAYIMPSGGRNAEGRKHDSHLLLIKKMLSDELPLKLTDAKNLKTVFTLLREYPMMGDFLAYQFSIDFNYSSMVSFDEMDFVVPGPGARDGIRKCFPNANMKDPSRYVHFMAENQESFFRRFGISFESLWGRPLQLVDCQNLFCEVDKYSRQAHPEIAGESGRTRIKQYFQPTKKPLKLFYPPKWKINDRIPTVLFHI